MNNNKGFTLVELMAVIAIMAIIIGIAVPSYIGITKSTNQNLLNAKITNIKTKAEDYASANNIENTTITVETLIKEGYMEVDNVDNGSNGGEQITNPMGGYLDCYIVNISKTDGEYNVDVKENSDCAVDVDSAYSSNITIYAYENDSLAELESNKWTNKDVLLFADLSKVEGTINKVTWSAGASTVSDSNGSDITDTVSPSYDEYSNEIKVSAVLFLNTDYQVNVETSEGTVTKKVTVKIDKEKPYVDASVNAIWTKGNKKITINGSDGKGSGIYGFYIAESSDTPSLADFSKSDSDQITASRSAGTYYIYAIDNAGNISDAKNIVISNVDNDKPICKYPSVSSTWTTKDVTITYGCTDAGAGCKTKDVTKTYTEYTTETLEWTIEDNVGNTTDCSKTVIINIDKVTPTISSKKNPLSLGSQDYNFVSNVTTTFGVGKGTVECKDPTSRKTGTYSVTCTATGNNGLTASTTFTVNHSYAATYVSKTCTQSRTCSGNRQVCSQSCHNEQDCGYCSGGNWCCSPATCGSCCSGYYCQNKTVCSNDCHNESYSYDCSYSYNCSYYSCPQGGSLSGTTCNY